MVKSTTRQAAEWLLSKRLSLSPIGPLPPALAPRSLTEGYAIQAELNQLLVHAGMGEPVGYKIGCTTPVMQRFVSIDQPCAGRLFSRAVVGRHARIPRHGFVRLGIECEIAVRLNRDLPARRQPYDREAISEAVGEVMAAIELVDERYQDFRSLGVPTLVADDFFNAGCVLGEPVADWRDLDLAALRGRVRINGTEVGSGLGELVMAHPLNALAWLANAQVEHRLPGLKAGEFVMLGSVVETQWLSAGDRVRIAIDGLGEVALDLEA
jgi:2-oxo-3-hexenedioate decarboxylase/2-keto-4-pentenoate hydratase